MDDHTLYRKYRPKSFEDVVGQDHIVDTLRTMLAEGKVAHAILLAGTRGTGKTSIARIIAATLGVTPNDVYEIDAASNRGIDDIRALRESVQTLPFDSKYKVYIIDEVHMLTKEAFNALLKTLEEPPEYAIFILATTEAGKIPETIVSRCQVFQFRKPSIAVLKTVIARVAEGEGHSITPAAIELIAILGDGSFRDTLGILQKVLDATPNGDITRERVEEVTGAPPENLVYDLIRAIADRDADRALAVISRANEGNVSVKLYLSLILTAMRRVMLYVYAPSQRENVLAELNEHGVAFVKEMAQKSPPPINAQILARFLEAVPHIDSTSIPSLPLELAVVDVVEQSAE